MNRVLRSLLVALTALSTAGCGAYDALFDDGLPERADDGAAILVGAHAGSPAPALLGAGLARVEETVRVAGRVRIVSGSGRPEPVPLAADGSLDCANPQTCDRAVADRMATIVDAVAGVRAAGPESDLLAGMEAAAAAVRDAAGRRTLVVVDNGLSTAGSLRFQDPGVLDAAPAEIVEDLRSRSALPRLDGVTVVFVGLGDVAPPQEPLGIAQQENLSAIWTELVRAAGAADVHVVQEPLVGASPTGLPPVSVVPVAAAPAFSAECGGVLGEAQIGFEPDSAALRDPAATDAALAPLVRCLAGSGRGVRLTGCTASQGTPEGRLALSTDRAEAVAGRLRALGVADGQISARGLGAECPGQLVEDGPAAAAANRRVLVEPVPA